MAKERAKSLLKNAAAQALITSGALRSMQEREPRWRILMYHRVTTPEQCGHVLQPGMYVTQATFTMHMDYLAEHATVLPLDTLVEQITSGKDIPARTIAITFDDGWKDNIDNALPILAKRSLPATIFLATSLIGTHDTFWTDAIQQALSQMRRDKMDPALLTNYASRFDSRDSRISGVLARTALALTQPDAQFNTAVDTLVTQLKVLPKETRFKLADELVELSQIKLTERRAFLSWEECAEMSKNGITFGSHTHSHEPLDTLEPEEIQADLTRSFDELRANGLSQSKVFCYPEGRYSPAAQTELAKLGVLATLGIRRDSFIEEAPPLLGRVGLHNDVSHEKARFAARVWGGGRF